MKKKILAVLLLVLSISISMLFAGCEVIDKFLNNSQPKPCTEHVEKWVIDDPATCAKDGIKHSECETCGKLLLITQISATGHNYTTLNSDTNSHWYECSCGEKTGMENHTGGTATHTEKAICDICGESYGETLQNDNSELNGSYRLSHIKVGDTTYNLGDNFFGMTLYPERICVELNNGAESISYNFERYFATNITYHVEDRNIYVVCEEEVDLYNNGNKQKELVLSMEEIDDSFYFVLTASNGYYEFSYYIEKISLTLESLSRQYNDQLIEQAKSMAGSMIGNFEVVVLGKQETIDNIKKYTFNSIETDKIIAGLFVKFDVTNGSDDVLFTIYYNFGIQFDKKQNSNIVVTYDGSEYWTLEVVEENKTIVFEYSVVL